MTKVRVGINGYGVIGKRIADAVLLQDDMELVGVTARTPDFRLFTTSNNSISVYASNDESLQPLRDAGFAPNGTITDLISKVDVMIDTTPKGVGANFKKLYDSAGIKSIFQGGESHSLTNLSFVAELNYDKSLNQQSTRVVSCNTTGISRVLSEFVRKNLVERVDVALFRRNADPIDSHKNATVNTAVIGSKMPSHHAEDVQSIIPNLKINTIASVAPYNLSHLHNIFITLNEDISLDGVLELLTKAHRVVTIKHSDGFVGLHSVIELMRDMKRPRNDLWEVAVWEESIVLDGKHLSFAYQVHNEAIVVPENIDAIRSLFNLADQQASISKTNNSLGILNSFRNTTAK